MEPREILRSGRQFLDRVFIPNGFFFRETGSGSSSGGNYASGRYEKNDRFVEIHFRHSLGLVTYHMGVLSIGHEAYMRSILGSKSGNKYPGFSDDPLEAFRALAFDLKNFCSDFVEGLGEEFANSVKIAEEHEKRSGISRVAEFES